MFPGASSTGFYHAPLSKGLLVLTGTASIFNILFATTTRNLISGIQWTEIIRNSKLWQVLASTLYYSSTRDLICGSFLLYSYRIFERRYGSKKYASFIFGTTVIAVGLQLTTISVLKHWGHEVGLPPPGLCVSFGMLYATLVQYFCDIPATDTVSVFGLPISGKILVYSIALQMLSSSRESLVAGLCGLMAGIVYRLNLFHVQRGLKLPDRVASFISRTAGSMFNSGNPPVQPYAMGATLEVQRQQQLEHYEQQALRTRMGNLRNRGPPRVGQGYADVLVPPGAGAWFFRRPANDAANDWQDRHPDEDNANFPQQPMIEVSEEQVQTLVEMGFSRLSVLHALTTSNNDITVATNILLSQGS